MRKLFIILSLTTILFSSCDLEKVVDIGGVPITPHVVLNGLLYANSDTSYFYMSKSRPIYNRDTLNSGMNDKWGYDIINDAEFNLSLNGNTSYLKYSDSDTAYILLARLKEGDKVNLKSYYKGKELEAMAILPPAPQVVSVDTASFNRIEYGRLVNYTMFKLTIKDIPARDNYYRLLVNNRFFYLKGDTIREHFTYSSYYSNDPVLTDGYKGSPINSNTGLASSVYNNFSVFRNATFAGKEYTLSFYVENSAYYWYFPEDSVTMKRHLTVRLQSISEDLYKYYSSLQRSQQVSSDKVSEPIVVHTNIHGGLGILGACNEIKVFEYKNF